MHQRAKKGATMSLLSSGGGKRVRKPGLAKVLERFEKNSDFTIKKHYRFAGGEVWEAPGHATDAVTERLILERENAHLKRELARLTRRAESATSVAPSKSTDLTPEQLDGLMNRIHRPQPSQALTSIMTTKSEWDFI